MRLAELDSRTSLGSDVDRIMSQAWERDYGRPAFREVSALSGAWIEGRATNVVTPTQVRVILSRLGTSLRLSAPALDVVADGTSFEDAWRSFLECVARRKDGPWLAFDVGPTRRDEIAEGLDADPDEAWGEPDGPEDG